MMLLIGTFIKSYCKVKKNYYFWNQTI